MIISYPRGCGGSSLSMEGHYLMILNNGMCCVCLHVRNVLFLYFHFCITPVLAKPRCEIFFLIAHLVYVVFTARTLFNHNWTRIRLMCLCQFPLLHYTSIGKSMMLDSFFNCSHDICLKKAWILFYFYQNLTTRI